MTTALDVWATAKPYWDAVQPFATVAALIGWYVEHRRSNARDQREREQYEKEGAYRKWVEETFTKLYGPETEGELSLPMDKALWAVRSMHEDKVWSVYARAQEWKVVRRG